MVFIESMSLLLIAAGFGVIVGLKFELKKQGYTEAELDFITTLVSIIMTIVNTLLTRIISRLGVIEFPHSHTDEKIAKYSRVVFGSVLNCIFLPLLSMAIVEGELLGKRGLAGQMLNFSITNCVLPLTLMLFDPIHFTKRLILRVKWLRNKSNWTFIQ